VYKKPFWMEYNFSGSIFNAVNLDNTFYVCMDNTPPDSNLGVLVCFAQDKFGNHLASLSHEDRRDVTAKFVHSYYGKVEALEPLWYTDFDWAGQEGIEGGCATFWPPQMDGASTFGTSLNENFKRTSWIGSDLQVDGDHVYRRGYVDSAIRTGREEAKRLVALLEDKASE